jgi:hypothetical protein
MKWKSMIACVSKEEYGSFLKKNKLMTILLLRLIQEFRFMMKSKYVRMGVWKEVHGDQTFKKKQK